MFRSKRVFQTVLVIFGFVALSEYATAAVNSTKALPTPLIYRCELTQTDGTLPFVVAMGHLVLPGLVLTEWTELDFVNVTSPNYKFHAEIDAGPYSHGENLIGMILRYGEAFKYVARASGKVGDPLIAVEGKFTEDGVEFSGKLECKMTSGL
jgi:hypothetical protein